MSDIAAWLDALGLGRHVPSFIEQHITFDLLPELCDADLEKLGVDALGDRKRLLKAIAALAGVQGSAAALQPRPLVPEAERRQLTVMFCDLVGSTALSTRLDPEDWQRVIRGYHAAVTQAVAPYEGHVAQLLGDGVLLYFGYPSAHEDDAARAVRAALAALREVARLRAPDDAALQARIGIATGLVVVGEVGSGTPAAEHSASGQTPNLAARLQALAGAGEIVLSEQTRRLLGGAFELRSLGSVEPKGFAQPIEAWRVVAERDVASRFEAQRGRVLVGLIGRDSEVGLLVERWQLARDGEGQAVLLSGEAGIGKSRICRALSERLADEPHAGVLLQCAPHATHSALYPVVQHLARTAGLAPADSPETRVRKIERLALVLPAEALGHVLRLMDLPDGGRAAPEGQTAQQEKARTLEALTELLLALSRRQPVLYLVEDAHWIDPTTEELLAQVVERTRDAAVLVLVTCRPEYAPTWGSVATLTRLSVGRLGQRQCAALAGAVAGKSLPPEVLAEIIRKTDGVPLFVEELTRTVLESGLLHETSDGFALHGALPALAIPSTLQDSLMARLDRLAPAKEVAQAGAVIGREFSRRLLAAVLSQMTGARLDEALAELVRADLLVRRGIDAQTTYGFRHALIRDTAYHSMLKSQRVLRHRQIAEAIEAEPETAQPELLAQHWQEAGETERAIEQWSKAGGVALARGANREAVAAFERALALLEALPEAAQRMSDALDMRLAMGSALFGLRAAGGAMQIQDCYARAVAVAERLRDGSRLFPALWGLYYVNWQRGRYRDARGAAERLLEVARNGNDSGQLVEAHHALWGTLAAIGRPLEALAHVEQGAALYDPERHSYLRYQYGGHDPGVCCMAVGASCSWMLGYPERALRQSAATLARIDALGHPMTNVLLRWIAWLNYASGNRAAAAALAQRALEIAEQHGFLAWMSPMVVFVELAPDNAPTAARLEELHRSIADGPSTSSVKSMMCCVLVEAMVALRDTGAASRALASSPSDIGDQFLGEVHRFEGLLALQRPIPDTAAAERCFERAIEIARERSTKSFELRAATELAALWKAQGKREAALRLLGDVYGWFTEGFETPDLKKARRLLDGLQMQP